MEKEKASNIELTANAYPMLFLPKKCTMLESNCDVTDIVYIDLKITYRDVEDNETNIYSGLCNVKIVDSYDIEVHSLDDTDQSSDSDNKSAPSPNEVPEADNEITCSDSHSQVWIDPTNNPYISSSRGLEEMKEQYEIYQETYTDHITVEQHSTYISQSIYNINEIIQYSPIREYEQKRIDSGPVSETNQQTNIDSSFDKEFECGVFLSQLSEEIMLENENRTREEMKYVGLETDNDALRQLMSVEMQSSSKKQRTVIYLGHDTHTGQTIQNIAVDDPMLVCADSEVDNEVVIDSDDINGKKYECDKCKKLFSRLADFKKHIRIGHSRSQYPNLIPTGCQLTFMCSECGKVLKSQEKFELHCLGHGDPEVECSKCHKVFASKFTLRNHKKLHQRNTNQCTFCNKAYLKVSDLKKHMKKMHFVFKCNYCSYAAKTYSDLVIHKEVHTKETLGNDSSLLSSVEDNLRSINDEVTVPLDIVPMDVDNNNSVSLEEVQKADSVIAKVMSNKMFLLKSKRGRQCRIAKICNICCKTFDRMADLKRHLIEHVIHCTLAKLPVNSNGTLTIQCEVCRKEIFHKVDTYKAHLRRHAKLTTYECVRCDKFFADSSNFSKHKKIHGSTTFQCDLCQRKFNTKKMLVRHMEYHRKNTPLKCYYCNREFHFLSMLKKHIKHVHSCEIMKIRCRFCPEELGSLKDKWDHEWHVHNVRKMIVDCLLCGSKFRKYSELKRHCKGVHDMVIPSSRKLLRKRRSFYSL